MNHKQKVWLQLESVQGEDAISQMMQGEWYIKGNSFYLKYAEQAEAGEIRHLLKYEPSSLKVSRKGVIEAEQMFRIHERWRGYYHQNPIRVETEAFTSRLILKDKFDQVILGLPSSLPFTLQWEYELFVGEQSTGIFNLRLTVKEATAS